MNARPGDLVERGLLAPEHAEELRLVAEKFSVAITDEMAALIDPADPFDPIAAQFVPDAAELEPAPTTAPTRSATNSGRRCPASSTATRTGYC